MADKQASSNQADRSESRPVLTIIAGPNGAGKTSLSRSFNPAGPVINPDTIPKDTRPDQLSAARVEAERDGLRRASRYIHEGRSFTAEMTLSGKNPSQVIAAAKDAGFKVDLHYIGLDSAELAKARISERVKAGGHSIPDQDIEKRFARTVAALPKAIASADTATLYDNSGPTRIAVARLEPGNPVSVRPGAPPWVAPAIREARQLSGETPKPQPDQKLRLKL